MAPRKCQQLDSRNSRRTTLLLMPPNLRFWYKHFPPAVLFIYLLTPHSNFWNLHFPAWRPSPYNCVIAIQEPLSTIYFYQESPKFCAKLPENYSHNDKQVFCNTDWLQNVNFYASGIKRVISSAAGFIPTIPFLFHSKINIDLCIPNILMNLSNTCRFYLVLFIF